eukprot:gnl/MRDRNA2_/MRDRNA2_66370_c0_seq2.p1 gnl/MRDRNA2_/MRDRNA2_66370_c0~~gnl/MRDRNA2_/MRDRNA2_66370_c0_seq2.p1  ORF type:complete len:273 (+),score=59.69 gnl/MRDRNA2_/MRDRNA2_66370_c0_seq2:53-871(+)
MAGTSAVAPCKFFARGGCAFGASCRFAHVSAPGALRTQESSSEKEKRFDPEDGQIKSFVELQAQCSVQGYSLSEIEVYWQEECVPVSAASLLGSGSSQVCKYFLEGNCMYGSECQYSHQSTSSLKKADIECGICFENPTAKGSRIGMLENCDHVFCLQCIRSWRKQREQDKQNLRMCPLCRNESGFVVPCDRVILDPDEKVDEISSYKEEMGKIPCKLFDRGNGTCPFGASCFYAHLNADGTKHVPAPPRMMIGADGKSRVIKPQRLSDLFD